MNPRCDKSTVFRLFAIGAVGNTLYQTVFILGIYRTTASVTSLILASSPAFVTIINSVKGYERVGFRSGVGVVASFVGILLMLNVEAIGTTMSVVTLLGDILLLIGTVCWAAYTVLSRPMLSSMSPTHFVTYTISFGTFLLVLVSFPSPSNQDYAAVSPLGWGSLLFSAVLAITFGYIVWYSSVQKIGSARTAIYQNLTPAIAVVFAWLVLVGGALVLFGIYLTRFAR